MDHELDVYCTFECTQPIIINYATQQQ